MVVEMPRTKAPTGKRSGRKKNNIPSLESLSAQVDKEKNAVDGAVAVGTSATAERCNGSLVLYTGHGNLQTIFADSYVEHVNLAHVDGGRKKDLKALEPKSESMEIFLRVRPFLQSEVRRGEDLVRNLSVLLVFECLCVCCGVARFYVSTDLSSCRKYRLFVSYSSPW